MSATSDSIQTLLKQRRELRQCLIELRDEIADLNNKAETMSAKNTGKKQQTLIADPSSRQVRSQPAISEEGQTQAPSVGAITDKNAVEREEGENPVESQTENNTFQNTPIIEGNSDTKDNADEEIDGLQGSELFLRAKLLSDYLQNHPSDIPDDHLQRLEQQVADIDGKSEGKIPDAEVTSLRAAYRIVATQSFQELRVNGETLVDSNGSVPLLWGLPLTVAALTLVVFPIALLTQSIADRMFVDGFAIEISNVISCVVAFVWGGAGALSTVCWSVAEKVHKKQYLEGGVRDSALRFTLGGVLGIFVFLFLSIWLPPGGIINEMIIGVSAFGAGLPSGILFSGLSRLFGRRKKQALKS